MIWQLVRCYKDRNLRARKHEPSAHFSFPSHYVTPATGISYLFRYCGQVSKRHLRIRSATGVVESDMISHLPICWRIDAHTTSQVVGVGLAGGLLQAVLNSELRQRITGPGAAETIDQIRRVSSSIKDLPLDVRQQAIISYRMALRWVWILNAALACINIVICLFVSRRETSLGGSLWVSAPGDPS